jgi:hypothetical protein
MDLSDCRETKGIGERQVQKHGIEPLTTEKRESLRECRRPGNLELLRTPLRKEILRELSVDVIVFDEKYFYHPIPSLSGNP